MKRWGRPEGKKEPKPQAGAEQGEGGELDAEEQSEEKKRDLYGLLLPVLYAALAGVGGFVVVMLIVMGTWRSTHPEPTPEPTW